MDGHTTSEGASQGPTDQMLTVVTGWSPAGWKEYGRRFAETFDQFWPSDVDMVVYGEEPVTLPRGTFRTLDTIPGCMEFLERHDDPIARGRKPMPGFEKRWKPSHLEAGYSFRFDAWKFCRQGFIPYDAALQLPISNDPQYLCWLDGDVVTHRMVPRGFIEGMLPAGKSVAFLGRGEKHSEIGFQLYKLDGRTTSVMNMLLRFRQMYDTDMVFQLKEWHSAFVWDMARHLNMAPHEWHDLTPGGHGHVWHQSPLAIYTDHLKGKRKTKGRSDERRA